jgi:arylsulfatase A-like enzyme
MWIHYYDPHRSYNPPGEYKTMFNSETPDYDGEVRYVDDQLRRVIEYLAGSGALEHTIVVIVADHGEAFGEHRERGHGGRLYDTTIRVPLLIYNPGHPGGLRTGRLVGTVDIAPTILHLLNIPKPGYMQGENLYEFNASGGMMVYSETFYGERREPGRYMKSIITDDYKYVYVNLGGDMLFDRRGDPLESNNLLGGDNVSTNYKSILDDFVSRIGNYSLTAGIMRLNEEDSEKLRSLGYMV